MTTGMITEPGGYTRLRGAAAWCELPRRTVVAATGADSVAFVDGFTTAALGGLQPGQGTETLFTDARGWVLALGLVLRRGDGLEIDAGHAPGIALEKHLGHYQIRERVDLRDIADEVGSFLVAGPDAKGFLAAHGTSSPELVFAHETSAMGTVAVHVARINWLGDVDGFLIRCAATDTAAVRTWLRNTGLPQSSAAAIEALRIESRFPSPADIVEKTLPQELDRPALTISFTKGCYLGQETVARLDALGHVNRVLSLIASDARSAIPVGTRVLVDGVEAGVVTSSCLSPLHAGPVALSIVHKRAGTPGAAISLGGNRAWIIRGDSRPQTPHGSPSS